MSDKDGRLGPMIETVSGMRDIARLQIRMIDKCLHLLVMHRDHVRDLPRGENEVFRVISTMIHMVGISGHSLLKLTDEIGLGVKDAFPVARSLVEGAINVCFIMAEGVEAAEKAARHAEVKAYRDLSREWDSGGFKIVAGYSGRLRPDEIARLEAMLPEFTNKRGGEKSWTDKTLKQRLACVEQAFPSSSMISLNASAFNVYRHASEVVHGTYFSALYFWGMTLPGRKAPTTRDDLRLTLVDHQFSVLSSAIFAFDGLISCFAAYTNLPDLAAEARAHCDRLKTLPSIKEALAHDDGGKFLR